MDFFKHFSGFGIGHASRIAIIKYRRAGKSWNWITKKLNISKHAAMMVVAINGKGDMI